MSSDNTSPFSLAGLRHYPAYFDNEQQKSLLEQVRHIVKAAPLFTATMPRTGQPMSVRMTSCGAWGWYADKAGYRYIPAHPVTGQPWPAIPPMLLDLWFAVGGYHAPPDSCLINFYSENAKMGLHQDRDEDDVHAPVVSMSLGDDARFRLGGLVRGGKTQSVRLQSGDAFVLSGEGRFAFHGIDRIYAAASTLLPKGGRINLTMRRVRVP